MRRAILLVLLLCLIAGAADDWTLVYIPDPQNLASSNIFNGMTTWIVNNKTTCSAPGCPDSGQWNMQAVLWVGDISGSGGAALSGLPKTNIDRIKDSGLPFLVSWGNHDRDVETSGSRDITTFESLFGASYYTGKTWFGGGYPTGSVANTYALVPVPGQTLLLLNLEWLARSASHGVPVETWAAGILAAHPDKQAIISTHAYLITLGGIHRMLDGDTYGPTANGFAGANYLNGQETFDNLVKNNNVIATVNGHFIGGAKHAVLSSARNDGGTVHQFFTNYQEITNQANVTLLKFRPSISKIEVYNYSTSGAAFDATFPMYQLDWTPPVGADGTVVSGKGAPSGKVSR